MRKSLAKLVCGSVLLLTFCGCGGSKPPAVTVTSQAPAAFATKSESKEALKKSLEGIRRSGQLSSAMSGMRQTIEQLDDLDLVEDLTKEFLKLEKAKTSDEIKAITKVMMSKL